MMKNRTRIRTRNKRYYDLSNGPSLRVVQKKYLKTQPYIIEVRSVIFYGFET